MENSNDNEMLFIVVSLAVIVLLYYLTVSPYQKEMKLEKLIDYSSEDWSVTLVDNKETLKGKGGKEKYYIQLCNHLKAPVQEIEVTKELFDSLHRNEVVKYNPSNAEETVSKFDYIIR